MGCNCGGGKFRASAISVQPGRQPGSHVPVQRQMRPATSQAPSQQQVVQSAGLQARRMANVSATRRQV